MAEKKLYRFHIRFLDGSHEDLFAHDYTINGEWIIFAQDFPSKSELQPLPITRPIAAYKNIVGVEWLYE